MALKRRNVELYNEILAHALMQGQIQIIFQGQEPDISKIMEDVCYQTLQKIQPIIKDDRLEDKECFVKIEQIICILEENGISCGARHDFG